MHAILSGQAPGTTLLGAAIGLLAYFLPSMLSFLRAQKRFWMVLLLNLALTFVQSFVFHKIFPDLLAIHPGNLADSLRVSLLVKSGMLVSSGLLCLGVVFGIRMVRR